MVRKWFHILAGFVPRPTFVLVTRHPQQLPELTYAEAVAAVVHAPFIPDGPRVYLCMDPIYPPAHVDPRLN